MLYKGTITRLIAEDNPSRDRSRDENLAKGHVLYEGISGHILSYDRKFDHTHVLAFLAVRYPTLLTRSHPFLLSIGSPNPKEEGRGEALGLKRPYDIMESGGISRVLPLRDSLSTAEGQCR